MDGPSSLGSASRVLLAVATFGVLAAGSWTGESQSRAGLTSATSDPIPPGRSLVCKLPPKTKKLPASARRGLVQHLLQYPVLQLATPRQRARAERVLAQLVSASVAGNWTNLRSAGRAGYDTRTARRKPGDASGHPFHAERRQEPRRGAILDPRRPKALIYANAPGRPLVLVGAMWSTRDGERGPTPAGPIMRWHSHTVCKQGKRRGLKPPASGRCPSGSRLTQGTSEMLHVWFTGELRSAFAIRAPEPELCATGLLPDGYCESRS
jgi:hypothetical protein